MASKQAVRSLKATNIGPSSSITSLMVRITWTSAPVVKSTARQDFLMQASTINTKDGSIVAAAPVKVFAGTILYFAASSFPGWYYVCRVNASGVVSCTCPHHSNRHCCKHQPLVRDCAAVLHARARRLALTAQPSVAHSTRQQVVNQSAMRADVAPLNGNHGFV